MTRKNMERILAGTALVLISLTAAGAWLFISGDNQPPTIEEVMSTPSSLTENLYPAADLPAKVETASGGQTGPSTQTVQMDTDQQVRAGTGPQRTFNRMDHGRLVASFTTNLDKSSENLYYQDDGIGRSYLVDFYAPLHGDPGPRQKGIVYYAADGESFNSEEWDRLDGTAEKIGHALGGGYYVSSTLFADGQTAEAEQVWAPDMFSNGHVPKLEKEQRWRSPAEGHTIAYTDVLNDDGTREQTSFDPAGLVTMQKHIPLRPPVGTTVKEFFPGTTKVRLESTTDWWTTVATEYRLDGTRLRLITIRAASFDVRYFDPTGKVPLFEQTWLEQLSGRLKNGATAGGDAYACLLAQCRRRVERGWFVQTRHDDQRQGAGDQRHVLKMHRRWCHLAGRVFFWYREDGTLSKTELINPESGPDEPMKTVEHAAAEKITVVLPQTHLLPIAVPDELPVPPDNQPTGGR